MSDTPVTLEEVLQLADQCTKLLDEATTRIRYLAFQNEKLALGYEALDRAIREIYATCRDKSRLSVNDFPRHAADVIVAIELGSDNLA